MAPQGGAVDLIAFDLDNTLYDEGSYFTAAFKVIAPMLAARARVEATCIEEQLQATLREKGSHYHYLFSDILSELGLDPEVDLPEVLRLFRSVRTELALFPGARELLVDLGARYRLGLITSGMRAVQENKINLLGIADCFEQVVFSSTLEENKPGRMPFERLLAATHVEAARAVYIGDNPHFDFRGANELGMLTVRVHNPEFEGVEVAAGSDGRIRVSSVTELRRLFL